MARKPRKRDRRKARVMKEEARFGAAGNCDSCGQPLYVDGGYGGTGLCGPCCTGEASTLDEMGDEW
jgi:hypothetical protein